MINRLSEFIRSKRGTLSLRDFAKMCGNISHTQIDSIERGVDPRTNKPVRPTIDTLKKLSLGTGVTVAYLAALAADEDIPGEKIQSTPPRRRGLVRNSFSPHDEKIIDKFHSLTADNQIEIEKLIDVKLDLQGKRGSATQSTVV